MLRQAGRCGRKPRTRWSRSSPTRRRWTMPVAGRGHRQRKLKVEARRQGRKKEHADRRARSRGSRCEPAKPDKQEALAPGTGGRRPRLRRRLPPEKQEAPRPDEQPGAEATHAATADAEEEAADRGCDGGRSAVVHGSRAVRRPTRPSRRRTRRPSVRQVSRGNSASISRWCPRAARRTASSRRTCRAT